MPSPGRITGLRRADGPGIRDDSASEAGGEVPIYYDPMISKLIAWGEERSAAIGRIRRALDEYEVRGIRTTVPFFRWIVRQPEFLRAQFHTAYLDELLHARAGKPFAPADPSLEEVAAVAAAIEWAQVDSGRSRPASSDGTASTSRSTGLAPQARTAAGE